MAGLGDKVSNESGGPRQISRRPGQHRRLTPAEGQGHPSDGLLTLCAVQGRQPAGPEFGLTSVIPGASPYLALLLQVDVPYVLCVLVLSLGRTLASKTPKGDRM